MKASEYRLHPAALAEYEEAIRYYGRTASQNVAAAFTAAIERRLIEIVAAPTRWPFTGERGFRACQVRRFPYSIIFCRDTETHQIVVFAIAHASRRPGYWHERVNA